MNEARECAGFSETKVVRRSDSFNPFKAYGTLECRKCPLYKILPEITGRFPEDVQKEIRQVADSMLPQLCKLNVAKP